MADDEYRRLMEWGEDVLKRRLERSENAPKPEYVPADEFRKGPLNGFVFPLPKAEPGYGALNVRFEPIVEDGLLVRIHVQIVPTKDPRYLNKIFVIPAHAEALSTYTHKGKGNFFEGVMLAYVCKEHNALEYISYPPTDALELCIDTICSTSATVWYELAPAPTSKVVQ